MDKKKRFDLNLETFRDIFQICPRVQGQNFNELPTNEDIVSFFKELGNTREIKSITDIVVDQMNQPWRTFALLINRSLSGKTTGLDKLRLSRAQIFWGMVTPPKITRKLKIASPSKKNLNLNLVPMDEEPKSAKKKVPAKKTIRKQTSRVVLRDIPMVSLSKKKEKGRDKDDNNNDHNSSSEGSDQENDSCNDNTQSNYEKGSDSEQETNENETGSKFDQQENEEEIEDDEEEKEDEFVRTPSNYTPTDDEDETNIESKIKDNTEGDEDKGMDYTTNQLYDDVDVRLNNPIHIDEGFVKRRVSMLK
ncbi:hypothetical protein Tco_0951974 [Tanacetum coccineum]|uniref:Translocon at the inner envelope membrane of chloroplasts 214 n=1 Tax=Tanacetum coccineum TaxID=301880 RepID=A0ABQ5E1R3_9ASTR